VVEIEGSSASFPLQVDSGQAQVSLALDCAEQFGQRGLVSSESSLRKPGQLSVDG